MKEVNPEKGLYDSADYTEEEFNQAVTDGKVRQGAKAKKEEVEELAEMPLDGDDVLREGDTFVSPDEEQATGLSAEDARQIDSITLMRIYDLLGALLTHFDEETATAILEAHAEGKLVGPFPSLNI